METRKWPGPQEKPQGECLACRLESVGGGQAGLEGPSPSYTPPAVHAATVTLTSAYPQLSLLVFVSLSDGPLLPLMVLLSL